MPEKQYNIAVIGYGLSAKIFHIPFILAVPSLKLHSIVQRHPTADDDAEKDHPGIKSYRSSEEMLKDGEVDVVVITSIPDTHWELTRSALQNGKHVVCEKPFVPSSEEADELIALAKERGRLLTVYQSRSNVPEETTVWQTASVGCRECTRRCLLTSNLLTRPPLGRRLRNRAKTHLGQHLPPHNRIRIALRPALPRPFTLGMEVKTSARRRRNIRSWHASHRSDCVSIWTAEDSYGLSNASETRQGRG